MDLSSEDFEKLFEIFKIECDEHIQNLNSGLLSLEENPNQPGIIEEIFREAHSLKGAARMINFPSIENISHNMETILSKIKNNEMTLTTETANVILKGLDTVEAIINKISQGGQEDEVDSSTILNHLKQVANGVVLDKSEISKKSDIEPVKTSDVKAADEEKEEIIVKMDLNLFLQETGDAHQKLVNSLLEIDKNPDNEKEVENAFEQAHALKGSARVIKHDEMGNISFSIERALQEVLDKKMSVSSLLVTILLEGTDFIKTFITRIEMEDKTEVPQDFEKVIAAIDALIETHSSSQKPEKKSSGTSQSLASEIVQKKGLKPEISKSSGTVKQKETSTAKAKSTVRVSSDKLDRLMDQAGELLIMKLKSHQRLKDIQSIIDDCNAIKRPLKKRIRQIGRAKLQQDNTANDKMISEEKPFYIDFGEKFSSVSDRIELLHKAYYDDFRQLSLVIEKLQDDVKKTRLFPIQTILDVFPRMVRDISASVNKKIKLKVSGGNIELDKFILEEAKDPLMHIIRNCIDHGIESREDREKLGKPEEGLIQINVFHKGNSAVIEVKDDGKGIDIEKIKASAIKKGLYSEKEINLMKDKQILSLIFHPGFSTSSIITDISGRGIGMDVVKANIEKLNGTIDIETVKSKGTVFLMIIPLTLSTTQTLKISICGNIYFIPVNMVEKIIKVPEDKLSIVEGFPAVYYLDSLIPYVRLSSVLEIPESETDDTNQERPMVILRSGKNFAAFGIDKFMGEEEMLMKGLGGFMKRVRNVSGVTIMRDGSIALVLNVADMINTVQLRGIAIPKRKIEEHEVVEGLSVLVVDDSIMTRTMEKNILESYGYNILMAVDGQDALVKLQEKDFDIIVSDVQMPKMNGLELTEQIKKDDRYKHIPVILVTALESAEDKKKGIEVGADAYIVKSSFDQSNLLKTIKRLT